MQLYQDNEDRPPERRLYYNFDLKKMVFQSINHPDVSDTKHVFPFQVKVTLNLVPLSLTLCHLATWLLPHTTTSPHRFAHTVS